jgi:hypothetical protein
MHRNYLALPASQGTAIKRKMPRRKLFKKPRNLNVLLSEQTVRRIDKLIPDGESRTDFIREAVDREIERRESERNEKGRK